MDRSFIIPTNIEYLAPFDGPMTHSISSHDFHESARIARNDALFMARLTGFVKTNGLSLPEKSDLIASTCDVLTWTINKARKEYACDPHRLVCLVSAANVANAFTIWGSTKHDWIVLTEGLLESLSAPAEDVANRLVAAFPGSLESKLVQRLQAAPPLPGGFQTSLGTYLYFAAVSFLAGHEAGHHLAGHDGFFLGGAHAECDDSPAAQEASSSVIQQALELQADRIGRELCKNVITQLLLRFCDLSEFSEDEQREYQQTLAVLICGGVMMSAVFLKPKAIDWSTVPGGTHPPTITRLILLSRALPKSISENFSLMDEDLCNWISQKCLDVVVGATISPGTREAVILQERLARGGEHAAIRAVGIRKALFDPEFPTYLQRLDDHLAALGPQLNPRMKSK